MTAYPDGCTAAMLHARYDERVDPNEFQRAVEERADCEMSTNALVFSDWLMNREDISDLSRLVSFLRNEDKLAARQIVDDIYSDYVAHRIAQMTGAEQDEIEQELEEA